MDFGKHKYEMQKKEREAHKKAHASEVRLIRLKPQIDAHDLGIKVKKLREMLAEGDKVRIQLRFRGREMSRPHMGTELLNGLAEQVANVATIEGYPRLEGRMMNMLLAPKPSTRPAAPKEKKEKPAKQAEKPAAPEAPKAEAAPAAETPKEAAPPAPAEPPRPAPAKEDYGIGTQAEDTEDGGEAG